MTSKPPRKTRGVKGFGTIRFRSDGRWEGRYSDGTHPGTGKQKQKSVYGKTQQEVTNKLKRILYEIEQGSFTEPSSMTVKTWMTTWLEEYTAHLKESSFVAYESITNNHIIPNLGSIKLKDLKTPAIQRFYRNATKAGKAPKTVRGIHNTLNSSLNKAVELKYISVNPCNGCVLPRIPVKKLEAFDSSMLLPFMDAIKGHKYETLYLTALFTGRRESELLGLTWDCIDFDNQIITSYRQLLRPRKKGKPYRYDSHKNDKIITTRPSNFVFDILKKQKEWQSQAKLIAGDLWDEGNFKDLVFTNDTGRHLIHNTVLDNLKQILSDLNMPINRFHDLRHSYAVFALQAGDNIKTLQENLSHATVAFTLEKYGHVTASIQKESASRMDAFIHSKTTSKKPVKGQNKGQLIYRLRKKP